MSTETCKLSRPGRSLRVVVRPKIPASDRKEGVIKIRVTEADKRIFEAAAAKERMDLSTFTRVALIEKARRVGMKI
jgi:hypothetical protein